VEHGGPITYIPGRFTIAIRSGLAYSILVYLLLLAEDWAMPHALDGLMIFGAVLIGLFIGALILQAACVLYNKLAGVSAPLSRSPPMERRWEMEVAEEPRHSFALDDADEPAFEDADRPSGVPKLNLGQAMGIVCISAIANAVVGFLIGRLLGSVRVAAASGLWATSPLAFLIALPANILVMGATLPTSFGKGLLVALLYTLIYLILGIVIAAIVFAIILALGVLHNLG
jgi:hypothetical protein